jgi:hypothetical protein
LYEESAIKIFLISRQRKELAFGVEYRLLPPTLLDIFKGEINRRPELAAVKDTIMHKVRRMGNNERMARRESDRKKLIKLYRSPNDRHTLRGLLALTILTNDRVNLNVIDEPAPWSGTDGELRRYFQKWRLPVNQAFKRKFPCQSGRTAELKRVLTLARGTSHDNTHED